jgi:hypothetical protein
LIELLRNRDLYGIKVDGSIFSLQEFLHILAEQPNAAVFFILHNNTVHTTHTVLTEHSNSKEIPIQILYSGYI